MTPEGRVKKKVSAMLARLGPECWTFMPVQTGYGKRALDYLICYRGRFFSIETKAKDKELTALQKITKAAMEAAGAIVLKVDDDESLAVAMQIIMFEELGRGRAGITIPTRIQAQAQATRKQHLRKQHARKAAGAAVGGHHGTPGDTSERSTKSYTGL